MAYSGTVTKQEDAGEKVERAVAKAHPWIEWAARLGYIAKGLVYLIIGLLALAAAFKLGGGETSPSQTLNLMGSWPLGRPILFALAVGLAGYSLWRILAALFNPEDKPAIKRIGYVASSIAYGSLAYAAVRLALFAERASTDDKSWTGTILSKPMGSILLWIVGFVIIAVGLGQLWNSFKCSFCEVFKREKLTPRAMAWVKWTGRIGLAARGLLFCLIGSFVINTAATHDPRQAGGIDEALRTVKLSAPGAALLVLVAAGIVCYGIFMFLEAAYRRINAVDPQMVQEAKAERA